MQKDPYVVCGWFVEQDNFLSTIAFGILVIFICCHAICILAVFIHNVIDEGMWRVSRVFVVHRWVGCEVRGYAGGVDVRFGYVWMIVGDRACVFSYWWFE